MLGSKLMNTEELVGRLKIAGPDERTFDICGESMPGWSPGGAVFLTHEDGRWQVGSEEHGIRSTDREFDSEDEACERVWEIRSWASPAPRPEDVQPEAGPYAPVLPQYPFPPPAPGVPMRSGSGGKGWRIALAVGVPLLALAVLGTVTTKTAPAASPIPDKPAASVSAVGDCLKGDVDSSNVQPAACGPGARYKVVGVVGGQFQFEVQAGTSACDPYPAANALYWQGEANALGTGIVLCLEDTTVPQLPVVGDCVKGDLADTKSVAKTACGPEATYKVVGSEKAAAYTEVGKQPCSQVPATSATYSWSWENAPLAQKTVFCLQDLKNPDNHAPSVGDCLTFPTSTAIHFVACGKGKLKVLGKIDETPQFEVMAKPAAEICHDFPGSDKTYWQGFGNALTGTAFCLDTLRK
jgi:hypothetical protein